MGENIVAVAIWGSSSDRFRMLNFIKSGYLGLLFEFSLYPKLPKFQVFTVFEKIRKKYANKPYYYLETIAVNPNDQGKGYASQLIYPFLQKAKDQKLGVYTETATPENVDIYKHYGFKVNKEVVFDKSANLKLWSLSIHST